MKKQEPVTRENIKEILAEMRKESESMNKRLEWLWMTQAHIAEDVFYRTMKSMLSKKWIKVHGVDRNVKAFKWSEYDVVAINGTEIVVTEVKTKLKDADVKDFLQRKLPQFKIDFPKYADYKVYGGVAGLAVPNHVEKYAENQGLFVFTQHGEHSAMIANSPDFKPKAF